MDKSVENLTDKAKQVLMEAQTEADECQSSYIGSEHLLLGLLKTDGTHTKKVFERSGISYRTVKEIVEKFEKRENVIIAYPTEISMKLKEIIKNASVISRQMGHKKIGSEHLAYSLLNCENCVAAKIIEKSECSVSNLKISLFSGDISYFDKNDKINEKQTKRADILAKYGRDLSLLAGNGSIDPVIGREREIERVVRILCRRIKNNPCLVGEPGVGKTAIAEGLALEIKNGNVPENLSNKRIYALDLSLMIAGAKYRGEFEERLKKALEEAEKDSDIILFIDEIHTIIGAGSAEGAMDAANIIKPMLARGKIRLIGATTYDEYMKHIEKDAALERRFQKVDIREPSESETVTILEGLRKKYEEYHRITIGDDAIKSAALLSSRYINGRFLPDKAIDLLDEASSGAVIKGKSSIDESDIRQTLFLMTGIMLESDESRREREEFEIKKDIFGQDEAVSKTIEILTDDSSAENAPKSLIFFGPSGSGKSYLAEILSRVMYANSMLILDMSEYTESSSISKLIGSAPGYIGHNEGGILTKKLKSVPKTLILIKNISMAHGDVCGLISSMLSNGFLNDSSGKRVDFGNAAVIFTIDIEDKNKKTIGFFGYDEFTGNRANEKIRDKVPNAIYSSVQSLIEFIPLSDEAKIKIAEREIARIADKKKINLDEATKEKIIESIDFEGLDKAASLITSTDRALDEIRKKEYSENK